MSRVGAHRRPPRGVRGWGDPPQGSAAGFLLRGSGCPWERLQEALSFAPERPLLPRDGRTDRRTGCLLSRGGEDALMGRLLIGELLLCHHGPGTLGAPGPRRIRAAGAETAGLGRTGAGKSEFPLSGVLPEAPPRASFHLAHGSSPAEGHSSPWRWGLASPYLPDPPTSPCSQTLFHLPSF